MRFLKASFLLLALAMPLLSHAQMTPGQVRVFQVRGTVNFIDNKTGASAPLKRGQMLTEGYTIATGADSTALIIFSNGSSLNVNQHSSLDLSRFQQAPFDASRGAFLMLQEDPSPSETLMFLNYGEVVGKVKKLQTASLYDIQTPMGSAGIRGTTFLVAFFLNDQSKNYTMKVGNIEGRVIITASMPADIVVSDMGVGEAEMDPTRTLSNGEVPEQSVVYLHARPEVLGDRVLTPSLVPTGEPENSFTDTVNNLPPDIPGDVIPIPGKNVDAGGNPTTPSTPPGTPDNPANPDLPPILPPPDPSVSGLP